MTKKEVSTLVGRSKLAFVVVVVVVVVLNSNLEHFWYSDSQQNFRKTLKVDPKKQGWAVLSSTLGER